MKHIVNILNGFRSFQAQIVGPVLAEGQAVSSQSTSSVYAVKLSVDTDVVIYLRLCIFKMREFLHQLLNIPQSACSCSVDNRRRLCICGNNLGHIIAAASQHQVQLIVIVILWRPHDVQMGSCIVLHLLHDACPHITLHGISKEVIAHDLQIVLSILCRAGRCFLFASAACCQTSRHCGCQRY